ncbi:MAG: hypothetical protein M3434_01370, partial [Gemmatimonadota bacterium]|nr:hypothetical protein [Gemmatimonadota bacterium]
AGLRRGGASEGDVSITSTNELEPIEVRACQYGGTYPNCNVKPEDPPPDDGYCQDFPDDPMCAPGDDPGPGGPGGGDDPCYDCGLTDPDTRDNPEEEICPNCGERAPEKDEKDMMEAQLDDIKCPDVKAILTDKLNTPGKVLVFTIDTGWWGYHDSNTGTQ